MAVGTVKDAEYLAFFAAVHPDEVIRREGGAGKCGIVSVIVGTQDISLFVHFVEGEDGTALTFFFLAYRDDEAILVGKTHTERAFKLGMVRLLEEFFALTELTVRESRVINDIVAGLRFFVQDRTEVVGIIAFPGNDKIFLGYALAAVVCQLFAMLGGLAVIPGEFGQGGFIDFIEYSIAAGLEPGVVFSKMIQGLRFADEGFAFVFLSEQDKIPGGFPWIVAGVVEGFGVAEKVRSEPTRIVSPEPLKVYIFAS